MEGALPAARTPRQDFTRISLGVIRERQDSMKVRSKGRDGVTVVREVAVKVVSYHLSCGHEVESKIHPGGRPSHYGEMFCGKCQALAHQKAANSGSPYRRAQTG